MFKLIGTDGREYGPATADQIRQWIREHRVDRHTRVFVNDASDWTPAGLVPEFANDFPGDAPPPVISPASPGIISPPGNPPNCSMAKAGMLCGLLAVTVFCCCGGLPFNLLGLVFSLIALVQISENPRRYGGRDLAVTGLVFSMISCLILVFFLAFR
jgi:hypothetical protein